jgi:hypothetical protein
MANSKPDMIMDGAIHEAMALCNVIADAVLASSSEGFEIEHDDIIHSLRVLAQKISAISEAHAMLDKARIRDRKVAALVAV